MLIKEVIEMTVLFFSKSGSNFGQGILSPWARLVVLLPPRARAIVKVPLFFFSETG